MTHAPPSPRDSRRVAPRRPWRTVLLRLLTLSVITVLAMLVVLWIGQRRLIYPGAWMQHAQGPPPAGEFELWSLDLEAADGRSQAPRVHALLLPGHDATADRPGPAVVFLHGNGEVIQQWAPELDWYAQQGITVLIPEYRGFGTSAGSPSQSPITADLRQFVDRLAALDTVDPDRLIYHGRSMGGGFAAQLLDHRPPAALILASSFTSFAAAAADMVRVPRWLIRDPLPVTPLLRAYPGPTLILHGRDDRVVSVSHAQANAAAAQHPTFILYDHTGHNTMPRGHGDWADIAAFLAAHDLLPTAVRLPSDPDALSR